LLAALLPAFLLAAVPTVFFAAAVARVAVFVVAGFRVDADLRPVVLPATDVRGAAFPTMDLRAGVFAAVVFLATGLRDANGFGPALVAVRLLAASRLDGPVPFAAFFVAAFFVAACVAAALPAGFFPVAGFAAFFALARLVAIAIVFAHARPRRDGEFDTTSDIQAG